MSQPQTDSITQPSVPAGLRPLGIAGLSVDGMLSADAVGFCADGVCHIPSAAEKSE